MGFNGCKCKVMDFGINNPKYMYTFTISDGKNTTALGETVCEKDLGVHVDNLLTFEQHIDLTTMKASCMLLRNISLKSPSNILPLFKSLVWPFLEYDNTTNNTKISPHNFKLIKRNNHSFIITNSSLLREW